MKATNSSSRALRSTGITESSKLYTEQKSDIIDVVDFPYEEKSNKSSKNKNIIDTLVDSECKSFKIEKPGSERKREKKALEKAEKKEEMVKSEDLNGEKVQLVIEV